VVHRPVHREPLGEWRERVGDAGQLGVHVELDALQEQAGFGVGVLIGLDDVAAPLRDEGADTGDDARLVGALQEERGTHVFWIGGSRDQNSVRPGSTPSRRVPRSISTHATPLLAANTFACGLICWATSIPTVGANRGSRSSRSW